ncbi:MAG TPA: sulfur carrier protein ThiS [Microlunatus sp.]
MRIYVNGAQREVAPGTLLSEVVGGGEPTPRRGIAVAVDGSVVPRARLAETTLAEGAKVEIVTAVQGG